MKIRRIDFIWAGIVIFLLFLTQCKKGETIYKTERDTIQTVLQDTLIIEKEVPTVRIDTVYQVKYKTKWRDRFVDKKTNERLPENIYMDTLWFDMNYYIHSRARVDGFMQQLELGLYDNRPDSMFTKLTTNTITETKYISPRGFYIGGTVNFDSQVAPGVAYLWKKNFVSVGYNLGIKGPQVGYYRRLK